MALRKVQCWIFCKSAAASGDEAPERCLLLRTNVARGNFWQPVTGTVEPEEGYFEAACREPLEETGLPFRAQPLDSGYEFVYTSRFGPAHERVFALEVDGEPQPPNPTIDPKEHDDFKWVHPLEALTLLRYPSNIDGLKRTFALVFGKELT